MSQRIRYAIMTRAALCMAFLLVTVTHAASAQTTSVEVATERAGIKMGDVIKSINGASPETKEDAVKMLGLLNFGEEAQLSIQRAGKNEELRFTAM